MSKHFTHLHTHTEYSLLDGAIRIKDLVLHAKNQGWQSIGISDHGNIFGAVKFFQEAKKMGIKPVLGCEMYFCQDVKIKDPNEKYYHLLIIVQNRIGYKNLCKLLAFAYRDGYYYKPRIDYEQLKKNSEGLIATTACLGGHIPRLLRHGQEELANEKTEVMLDTFGRERFYIEVQPGEYEKQQKMNEQLFLHAKKYDLHLIATSDAHYLSLDDHYAHEILLSVQTHAQITDPNRYSFGEARCFLRSTETMLAAFPNNPEAIWNTGKISDMCDFSFEFEKLFFPKFEVPKSYTQENYFRYLCIEGLETLLKKNLFNPTEIDTYRTRLMLEIDIIIKMGFIGYFLIVSDIIKWAKNNAIPVGPGRGSVAGSLIAWTLDITNVDPIKYNLLFERFLNPERVSMPDIDIDFCIERREEVINYVRNKYGHNCVCQIITFGTMMAKGVIKDVARTLGFPFKDATAITDLIPDQLKITIDEAIAQDQRLKEMIETNPKVAHLIEISKKLEGLTRHASKHAAGIVISPDSLEEMLPLYIPPKTSDLVAQYAMTELEAIGFLKMDFLGLKNLTLINRCINEIKKNHNIDIDLNILQLNDEQTLKLLGAGKSTGIFQFESDGIKDVLIRLKPNKFEDLIAVNALYRPGPLGSGMVDDFINRRHGRTKTTFMFAELEPILSETYGVIIYQEQVMKIASTIAGFSLGAADILRRAMGKKKANEMAKQKETFVHGAKQRSFDSKKAGELFDLMAYFAGYGFNKSHSTAYALIAYHTAYLKTHYPCEFMAALLSFETGNPEKLTTYLQATHEMGIVTLSPNINHSHIEFTSSQGKILFGLQGIKNVGHVALLNIIKEREKKMFVDLLDFCTRVDLRCVNKRVIESLIGTGAMDTFPGNRAQKQNELEHIISLAINKKEILKTGQMSMFMNESTASEPDIYSYKPCEDWSDKKKLEIEKELAGFYLSSHPLKTFEKTLKLLACPSFAESLALVSHKKNSQEPLTSGYGLLQSYRIINTKRGDRMAFVELEDFTGSCELIIFPKVFKKIEQDLESHSIFFVKGTVDLESNVKCKIKVNDLIPIEKLFDAKELFNNITLSLPEHLDESLCNKIKTLLPKGKTPVHILFHENNEILQIRTSLRTTLSLECIEKLTQCGVTVQCYP